jgi:hypothetical protein
VNTRADGDNLALRGLLLGAVGDNAAGELRFGINLLHNNTIVSWEEFHKGTHN